MNKRIKINVTAADIQAGVRCDARNCIVAEAIKRTYPQAARVRVDLAGIRFSDTAKRVAYRGITPLPALKCIQDFDAGGTVAPFTCVAELIGRRMPEPRGRVTAKAPVARRERPSRTHYRTNYLRKYGLCQLVTTP